ncbi:hypothetical protein KIW84_056557 [Lathyrus oleraceus]|uniref:Uncharacterized protein n=1 Tax=Pisum sativum TaxID=3888 RepID=A0A9D5AH19_PEA|nr:hypothetical protein KIW84_056557 [Pisum sativum]
MNTSSQLFLSLIAVSLISLSAFGATTTIHPDEKKALQDIANSLGKKNWNFDTDPCSNKNWFTELENSVTCNCSVAGDNFCHVVTMDLTGNQMSGNIPSELGSLTHIRTLQLSSNNFTRELPATLAKLTALRDFRISDNQLSGKIPGFIQNWTNIDTLIVQGSGLSGPIPSEISLLRNIIELRISDLNGSEYAPLPQLSNMKLLTRL